MRTLASEFGAHFDRDTSVPRVYVDANVPARMVAFMRDRLEWDVLFVLEHADLRRARDTEHFRLARDMRRTLVSLDHDYFDDRHFPPAECGGVVVIVAVDERAFMRILSRMDRECLRRDASDDRRDRAPVGDSAALPLAGRKLLLHG